MSTLNFQLKKMNYFVSPAKANRLFWLGRYVERVYMSLSAVKKYIDSDVDSNAEAFREYCKKISIPDVYADSIDFRKKYLYDKENRFSIYAMLINAFDNGIELREDISSETLSFIHISLEIMEKCAKENARISKLHPVSDYMLSFWGCTDENVIALTKMNILRLGRRVESLDMNVRLGSNWDVINEILKGGILTNADMLPSITDRDKTLKLKTLIEKHSGENHGEDSSEILSCINGLFKA